MPRVKPAKSFSKLKYQECIPLLIEDIPRIQFETSQKHKMTVFGVPFSKLLVYGHAIPLKYTWKYGYRIYLIDDGTGSVTVHHECSPEKMRQKIDELSLQISDIQRDGFRGMEAQHLDPKGDKCKEIVASMETVLSRVKKQSYLPDTFFTVGRKVSIIGSPFLTKWGEIKLATREMFEDSGRDRSKEIYFKKCLIKMYTDTYLNEAE